MINTTLFYYLPIFNTILNLLLILSQIAIVYITKPVNSLLYLIVILTLFGIQLLLFNFEFYFVLLIIVYLGGISILFLSAVMTLTNFKTIKLNMQVTSFNSFNFNNLFKIQKELLQDCHFFVYTYPAFFLRH